MNLEIPVNQDILKAVAALDRFKGQWVADSGVPATRLVQLEAASRIRSVAASCRMAGIRLTDAEVAGVLDGRTTAGSAREVLGYAAALAFPLPPSGALVSVEDMGRLHAVMSGETGSPVQPSPWRQHDYYREAFDAEGNASGRVFCTLPPHMLAESMDGLVTWLELELRTHGRHPTLVIGTFVLGVLAASPYEHSNGRLARLLMRRLLERAGYAYLPYASIEAEIEELRDRYHAAYDQAQRRFWMGEADVTPWLEFFLEVLTRHRERVEAKLALEREALDYPPLQRTILETVREHGTVDAGLLLKATGANRNTLKDNLRRLVDLGALERTGQRRGTRYRLAAGEPPIRGRES